MFLPNRLWSEALMSPAENAQHHPVHHDRTETIYEFEICAAFPSITSVKGYLARRRPESDCLRFFAPRNLSDHPPRRH